ncbi:MAG: septal ring lytic transglycosylase RlpA family protein [Bacteroidales bacterium]|nr:septal ring lytic transglycosylase RlpA family protein [Bacteroidales bacterium]
MKNIKAIALTALLLLPLAGRTMAQNYDPADTTTIYPLHGTYYHDRFVGRKTASGEVFSQKRLTAAHWKIKLGTIVLVTNPATGQQVLVKVNDRCPRRGVFDMSRRAARAVGIKGSRPVQVRLLGPEWKSRWEEMDAAEPDEVPEAPTEQQAQEQTGMSAKASHSGLYDLFLGTATSRAEATEMLKNLPEKYHPNVEHVAEYTPDGVSLILRLGQSRHTVEALRQKVLPKFPEATLRERSKH